MPTNEETVAYFWFDESIHPRGGFALGAFVVSLRDESDAVAQIVSDTGVGATIGEYKSGVRMSKDTAMQRTRELLVAHLAERCRLLVTAVPYERRLDLGSAALGLLSQALSCGSVPPGDHIVFFDQGIDIPTCDADETLRVVSIRREQNSRLVGGLQLADLAAHTMSMILLQHLGVTKKILEGAGPAWGYDDGVEIDLAFALWAPLRRNFLSAALPPLDEIRSNTDMFVQVEGYGLFVPPSCEERLAAGLRRSFGTSYLGCMH